MKLVVAALALSTTAGGAYAERSFHAGIDGRTDFGTHPVRVPVGIRSCSWDATLVLDPMVVLDGEHTLDAIGEWYAGSRIALLFGWRWSALGVADGTHHQQRSLVGVTLVGPDFWDRRIRTRASLELATLWVKHGGGAATDWISIDRNFLDHLGLGLSVRVEYALPL